MVDESPADLPENAGPEGPMGRSDEPLANTGVHYEPTDISFRGVLFTVVIAASLVPFYHLLTWKLFEHDRRYPEESLPVRAAKLPHEPRLEQLDRLSGVTAPNVYRRQAEKEQTLRSYGPGGEDGFVHVPIDWAIQQAAEQLPFKTAAPARDRGLIDAGESNSGRVFRGE